MNSDKYIHSEVEDNIYSYWEKHELFKNATPTNELVISATTNDAEDDHFMEKVKSVQAAPVSAPESSDSDEDDTLSYFKSLAEDS